MGPRRNSNLWDSLTGSPVFSESTSEGSSVSSVLSEAASLPSTFQPTCPSTLNFSSDLDDLPVSSTTPVTPEVPEVDPKVLVSAEVSPAVVSGIWIGVLGVFGVVAAYLMWRRRHRRSFRIQARPHRLGGGTVLSR